MIVDITNEIMTKLINDIPTATVVAPYQQVDEFPRIVLEERSNNTHTETIDSSGEKHNELMFEITIYTVGNNKQSLAKTLRSEIDDIMSDFYSMDRIYSNPVDNFLDRDIYRYILRYTCVVDNNKQIYRR